MWMHYYRSELPIRATHTNNHIESFNRKIKRRIKRNMHFTKALEELLLLIDEHYEDILIKLKYSIKINTTKYNEDWLNQIKTDLSKKCLELVQEENT
jgi:transposase-like protein